jgi:hypothetical protein
MHPGIVYDIDTESDPPRMMVCLLGDPLRYACVELERVGATREESFWSAMLAVRCDGRCRFRFDRAPEA